MLSGKCGVTGVMKVPDMADSLPQSESNVDVTLKMRRLHLGCGQKFIPGFYHVDIQSYPHVDQLCSVDKLSFVPDDTAELVLRPGDVLRLSVPDFSACAAIYYEQGLKDGLSGLVGLVSGGQRDETDFHHMIFDAPLLSGLLLQAGYSEVRRWDWRNTEHSDVDDYSQAHLPHMDKENGRLMSLKLEAIK